MSNEKLGAEQGRGCKPKIHPQVRAWRKWLGSEEGRNCFVPGAVGPYLENRLLRAFQAGWKRGKS